MTRKRIEIKKIDNISNRQVTFSKRRKGLFKKAQELSTLCDADVALMVFSSTNKLFHYATSSMEQVIERRNGYSSTHRLDNPSNNQLLVESDSNDTLSKRLEDKSRELRQLNGEDLQELTAQELHKLESLLKRSLSNVSKIKDEMFMQDISTLERKEMELIHKNQKLKHLVPPELIFGERQQSLESVISGSSYIHDDDGSDTSLKLGFVNFL